MRWSSLNTQGSALATGPVNTAGFALPQPGRGDGRGGVAATRRSGRPDARFGDFCHGWRGRGCSLPGDACSRPFFSWFGPAATRKAGARRWTWHRTAQATADGRSRRCPCSSAAGDGEGRAVNSDLRWRCTGWRIALSGFGQLRAGDDASVGTSAVPLGYRSRAIAGFDYGASAVSGDRAGAAILNAYSAPAPGPYGFTNSAPNSVLNGGWWRVTGSLGCGRYWPPSASSLKPALDLRRRKVFLDAGAACRFLEMPVLYMVVVGDVTPPALERSEYAAVHRRGPRPCGPGGRS